MIAEEQVTVYTCDGCQTVYIAQAGEEAPNGFYGTVAQITGSGGSGAAEWFADKPRCVAKAVAEAVNRAWD